MIRKILPFKRDIIISSNYKKNVAALSALIHVYSQRDFLHKRVIRFYLFVLKKVIYFTFPLYLPCLIFFDLYADESFICHGKGDLEALMPQCFSAWQCLLCWLWKCLIWKLCSWGAINWSDFILCVKFIFSSWTWAFYLPKIHSK